VLIQLGMNESAMLMLELVLSLELGRYQPVDGVKTADHARPFLDPLPLSASLRVDPSEIMDRFQAP
jgi:hypothetical protein